MTAPGDCVQVGPPLPRTHSTVIPANSRLSRSRTDTAASSNSHSQRRWHRGQRQNVSPCVKISSTAQHSDAYSPDLRASSEVLILGLLLLFESSHRKQLSFQTGLGCLRYSTARMTVKQSNLPEYEAKMSGGHDHVLALTSTLVSSSGRLGVGPSSLATG